MTAPVARRRAAATDDLAAVLALNNAAVPAVNELSLDDLEWFLAHAVHFVVSAGPEGIGGFLIGLGPGVDYPSHNYRWFSERYESFVYVDRIVVAPGASGGGLGQTFYREFATLGRERDAAVLVAEVNTVPRNDRSLAFHARFGFEVLAERAAPDGDKRVAMLAFDLGAPPDAAQATRSASPPRAASDPVDRLVDEGPAPE